MTWTSFTLFLLLSYALYYGVLISIDWIKAPVEADRPASAESLRLIEDISPVEVNAQDFDRPVLSDRRTETGGSPTEHSRTAKQEASLAKSPLTGAQASSIQLLPESGGVSIGEMVRLYRQKAILQSSRYNFTS